MIDFENSEFLKLRAVDPSSFSAALNPLLIPGEEIVAGFKTVRDGVVFTNKRVIAINVQGITGKKVDYTSLPYKKIQSYSVETAGMFDLDGELELWFSSVGRVRFEFSSGSDLLQICALISEQVL
ncbi:MAG TPA: PH domain-containing protein [Candidatus Faecalibacterium intestinipullorum]|uniref:Bacterial Pleckstrin homology domain-containing protein n=1 Tax=Faecalibacterium gallinarum TaxID=2903556 RepID=A0AA37MY03_9FIRM|nr:PH domain-containing protein [Faecalibacterium gallinarum]GJN63992.1 hypothetical protein JCM17207_06170 [Faecalibacterium gallinarum]HIV51238.1 PH domain-containing protein [Candidatus Faecalibacterium intestinipullorum]